MRQQGQPPSNPGVSKSPSRTRRRTRRHDLGTRPQADVGAGRFPLGPTLLAAAGQSGLGLGLPDAATELLYRSAGQGQTVSNPSTPKGTRKTMKLDNNLAGCIFFLFRFFLALWTTNNAPDLKVRLHILHIIIAL